MNKEYSVRIAYSGDYPGMPYIWIDGMPLNNNEESLFCRSLGVRNLKELLDKLKVEKIHEEHKSFEGKMKITL